MNQNMFCEAVVATAVEVKITHVKICRH